MLKKKGATLIEVIVAVALIVIVSIPISTILLHSSHTTTLAAQNADVTQVVQNKMEDIKNQIKSNGDSFILNQMQIKNPSLTQDGLNTQLKGAGSTWSEEITIPDNKYRIDYTVKRADPQQDDVLNTVDSGNVIHKVTYPKNLLYSPPSGTDYDYLNLPSNVDTVSLTVYQDSRPGYGTFLQDGSGNNVINHKISFTSNGSENFATVYFNTSGVTKSQDVKFCLKGLTGQYHLYCVFFSTVSNDNTVYNPNVTVSPYSSSALKVTTDYISDITSFNKDNSGVLDSSRYWYNNYLYRINMKIYKADDADSSDCLYELNSGCMIRRKS